MARLQQKHGAVPWRFVTADHFGLLEEAVDSLLDEGIETLVIAPAAPIYSHHEEFNGSFRHASRTCAPGRRNMAAGST